MDTTQTFPDWLYALLESPEEHDSEWGRSCHFCGSSHGRYDQPLEHYIDCPWVEAILAAASDLTDQLPPGHLIFKPVPSEPCEKCGWYYNSPDDWRGRLDEMPPPASEELRVAHDTHIAEEHGITYEEYMAGPPKPEGAHVIYDFWMNDGPMAWHQIWGTYSIARLLPSFPAPRGGISVVQPPDLSDEAVREPDA